MFSFVKETYVAAEAASPRGKADCANFVGGASAEAESAEVEDIRQGTVFALCWCGFIRPTNVPGAPSFCFSRYVHYNAMEGLTWS
jgi:hypothetical protein